MVNLADIEAAWGVTLPSEFLRLYDVSDWHAVQLPTGELLKLHWPLLTLDQINTQCPLAIDWEIKPGLLPFMGDMHNVICLDYRCGGEPSVLLLNDERVERTLFPSIAEFISARCVIEDEPSDVSGIIEAESWLDF